MLDEIDSMSDMVKGDDRLYRAMVEKKQRERFTVFESDGYNLFDHNGNKLD